MASPLTPAALPSEAVGYDAVLLAAFALTGWAFWRGRQVVIVPVPPMWRIPFLGDNPHVRAVVPARSVKGDDSGVGG